MKRDLNSIDGPHLEGQRALLRADLNVPMKDGAVADITRIRAALPTVRWLCERGCRVVLLSHLGRPGGKVDSTLSLKPVARAIERELGSPVVFIADPTSDSGRRQTRHLKRGEVAIAENTRFYPGEESNDRELAERFAQLGDFFVNDAFGCAHRAHASTEGVARLLKPAVAGFLMSRELEYLGKTLSDPNRPFVAVLGGKKISDKVDMIENLLPKVDEILIGGAISCTFFLAMGLSVGNSVVETDRVELARSLIERGQGKIVVPKGSVIAEKLESGTTIRSVPRDVIPEGWSVFDIDEATRNHFVQKIVAARTIFWNGPMGVFEVPPFDSGSVAVARGLARATKMGATTIVGGGDAAAAITAAQLADEVSHVSTGGGASLELLGGRELPGVAALEHA